MKKNLIVAALSLGALVIGAQSASALVRLNPMAEANPTATPVVSLPWQNQKVASPACGPLVTGDVRRSLDVRPSSDVRRTFDVRPTFDARPSFDVRTGDSRGLHCGLIRGHRGHARGHHFGTGDARPSFDVRGSFDVRESGDIRQSGDARHGHFNHIVTGGVRPLPPVFTADIRGPKPGLGFGRGHGPGNKGDGQGFIPPVAPVPTATPSATPVTGAAVQPGQPQAPSFAGRDRGLAQGGGHHGNH